VASLLAVPGGVLLVAGLYEAVKADASPGWPASGLLLLTIDALMWAALIKGERMARSAPGRAGVEVTARLTFDPGRGSALTNGDQKPNWSLPGYFGRAAAIDGMGTVAAPFLAGIAIALAVLVISNPTDFGEEGMSLFALVLATTALVSCVECAFWARQYAVTPSQFLEWGPPDNGWLEAEQAAALASFESWSKWARRAYNFGILGFAWAIVAMLVPAGGLKDASDWRLAAFALAGLWLAYQIVQILIVWVRAIETRDEAKRIAARAKSH
jgi:hypothetical protein